MEGTRLVWLSKEKVSLENYKVRIPEKGEVLIKSLVSLISPGTERAFLKALPNTVQKFPFYPGYSNVGEIIECGDSVSEIKPGDIVFSDSAHWSHTIQKQEMVTKIPHGINLETAAFINLAVVSLQGIRKTKIEIGESVLILGMGIVGIFALQFAFLSGAIDVFVIDPLDDRLSVARKFGASQVFKNHKEFIENLTVKPPIIVDTTGIPDVIPTAFELAKEGGRVEILGSPRGMTKEVEFYIVHRKGLQVIGAHNYIRPTKDSSPGYWTLKDDINIVVNLLKQKRLSVDEIPSKKYCFKDAKIAYDDLLLNRFLIAPIFDWRC